MSVTSASAITGQVIDPKTGYLTRQWQQVFLSWQQQLGTGFDQKGNLIGNINPTVGIVGRLGTIGGILFNIDKNGVVQAAGMAAATSTSQGAILLPSNATTNQLGTAAIQPASSFDSVGSAAAAQTAAESFAQTAADTAQSNAEAFSSDAGNITTGTLDPARLSGISVTVTTAKLTGGGANGSLTFTNGLLTSEIPAT
jgi:hypothetical protein